MGDRSIQVWIVCATGYEYTAPIKVWNNKKRAYQHKKRLEETEDMRDLGVDFTGYAVIQVPMIFEGGPF